MNRVAQPVVSRPPDLLDDLRPYYSGGLYLDPPDRALVLCCDEKTKEAVAMSEGFRRQVLDLYRHRPGEGSAAFHVELDIYYINQQGAVRRRFTKTPKWAWLRRKGYEMAHFYLIHHGKVALETAYVGGERLITIETLGAG